VKVPYAEGHLDLANSDELFDGFLWRYTLCRSDHLPAICCSIGIDIHMSASDFTGIRL
jgi:hypothetical protein